MEEVGDNAGTPDSGLPGPAQPPHAPPDGEVAAGANSGSGGGAGEARGERTSSGGVNQVDGDVEMSSADGKDDPSHSKAPSEASDNNSDEQSGRILKTEGDTMEERLASKQRSIPGRVLSVVEALNMPAGSGLPARRNPAPPSRPGMTASWEAPSGYAPDGAFRFVGVPAHMRHLEDDRYMRDGYAGLEVLTTMECFSATDLADLNELVGEAEDVNEFFLRPRAGPPPSPTELEALLDSVQMRRELASILSVYDPHDLALRAFSMTTFMRRLLIRYWTIRGEMQATGSSTIEKLLTAQKESSQFEAHVTRLQGQWRAVFNDLKETKEATAARYRADFKKRMVEHEVEKQALRDRIAALEVKLKTSSTWVESLESEVFNVDRMMNLLNRNQTKVTGNWKRLEELFKHHRSGTTPPTEWQTLISVTSAYDAFTDPGPFEFRHDGDTDTEEKGNDGSESSEGGTGSRGKRVTIVDVTGEAPPGKTSSSERRSSGGKRRHKAVARVVNRPIAWNPNEEDARPMDQEYPVDENLACASLAGLPVVWRKLRTDLHLAMRTGLTYSEATTLLNSAEMAHHLFHPYDLSCMLAQMMYWNQLDKAYWTTYVPERYFLHAESILDRYAQDGLEPDRWPDQMDPTQDDSELLLDENEEDVDNEDRDGNWEPSEEAQAKIDRMEAREAAAQQDVTEVPDANAAPDLVLPSTRSPKRRASSVSSQSDSATTGSGKKCKKSRLGDERKKSPLARKEMKDLTPEELTVIEEPGRGITSWRHKGILTTFAPSTTYAVYESAGFPGYAPNHNGGTGPLKDRFNVDEYRAIMETRPGERMYKRRVINLLFHKRYALGVKVHVVLTKIVKFMKDNALVIWYAGHWVTYPEDSSYGVKEKKKRKGLHDPAIKKYAELITELLKAGAPKTILYEPGIWVYPVKVCPWILFDKSEKKPDGKPYTMAEQLEILDREEPARIQWTGWTLDRIIADRPAHIRKMLLSPDERANNWVCTDHRS